MLLHDEAHCVRGKRHVERLSLTRLFPLGQSQVPLVCIAMEALVWKNMVERVGTLPSWTCTQHHENDSSPRLFHRDRVAVCSNSATRGSAPK